MKSGSGAGSGRVGGEANGGRGSAECGGSFSVSARLGGGATKAGMNETSASEAKCFVLILLAA
jgi:hypothetical protein